MLVPLCPLLRKMAGILDSSAYFKARLVALNLGEFMEKFDKFEWNTMAAFAFSANFVPGRTDDSVLVEKVFGKIFGRADHPREHAVRRLFFEAFTLASHDITRRLSHPEDEGKAPRKLPLEERGERMRALKKDLECLNIRGELEPSNALIDKFVEMEELNELRYLKWEEYTKRDQESKGVKKIPLWSEQEGKYAESSKMRRSSTRQRTCSSLSTRCRGGGWPCKSHTCCHLKLTKS